MRGIASANTVGRKPRSLMERLALVAGSELPTVARGSNIPLGAAAYFSFGLVAGGAAGAILLAMLPILAPGSRPASDVPPAIAALAPWAPAPERQAPTVPSREIQHQATLETFDVTIDQAARDSAPFGFRLIGADSAGMEVVLRDVPATVLPSRGERRGPSTWALAAADLESLRLMLPHEGLDAFDVHIEVLAPSGAVAANSLARVRVIDRAGHAERKQTVPVETGPVEPPPPRKRVAGVVDSPSDTRTHASSRTAAGTTTREKVARASPQAVPASQPQPEAPPATDARHWPEGASGLGAVSRASDRQVWWKLPAPSWSPFEDPAGAR
jgi:hypothetical protein